MEDSEFRLEEISKNVQNYDEILVDKYERYIDNVKSKDVNKLVRKCLKSRPTLVYTGDKEANLLDMETI